MAPTIPDVLPRRFSAGTTVKFHRSFDDCPASDGWTYVFYANGATAIFNQAATTNPDDDSFDVEIPPAKTATLAAGRYQCEEVLTNTGTGQKLKFSSNWELNLEANIETAVAGAYVTSDERSLAIVNAAIEGRLTGDLQSYIVAGRQIQLIPVAELYAIQGHLRAKVYRLKNPGKFTESIEISFPGESDPDELPPTWADTTLTL